MAKTMNLVEISMLAGADLSASQYRAVKVSAADTVELCDTAGEDALGIVTNNPGSGEVASVAVGGVAKAKAGGTITAGALLKVDANGALVAAAAGTVDTSDAGAAADPLIGSHVVGVAITAAASGEVFSVLWQPRGAVPTTAA